MDAIITAATVLASYLNVATSNTNGYIYNAVYEDNQVAKVEVFNQDGKSLSRKLQYHYSYDAQVNPAKRNVLDLKNETCKNREKRNVLKISHTRHFKTTKKQSKMGCFYSF